MSSIQFQRNLERELESMLRSNQALRRIKNERQQRSLANRLDDDRPLEETLARIIRKSPSLATIFGAGTRLQNPFRPEQANESLEFHGKKFPTFFRFRGLKQGETLRRDAHRNMRCRLTFETDVQNDYLMRSEDPGELDVSYVVGEETRRPDYTSNLQDGLAHINISLPREAQVGSSYKFRIKLNDISRVEPIVNAAEIRVVKDAQAVNSGGGNRRRAAGNAGSGNRDRTSGLRLPKIRPVGESEYTRYPDLKFERETALVVKESNAEDTNGEPESLYDFYVNIDNPALKLEQKGRPREAEIVKARFIYGLVLVGLGLIHDAQSRDQSRQESDDEPKSAEDDVRQVSRAIAPVIVPLIEQLGALEEEDAAQLSEAVGF